MNATVTEPLAADTTAVADLLLVRYALRNSSPKKVREDVGKLLSDGMSAAQFDELRSELVSGGFLANGPRKSITLTDMGRERALQFLGLSELPPQMTWKTVVAKHLLPKATGLTADTVAKLSTGDKLAAHFLKRKYGLSSGAGASVNQVLEAVVCRELGFREETTLAGLLRAALSRHIGSEERLTKHQLAKQFPLFNTGLKSISADEVRCKLVQDWLADAAANHRNEPHPPEQLDLPAFASTVLALAGSSPPADRFHDNKVFIVALWRASQRELNFPRLTLPEFKRALVEANSQHLLHLSRADLVHTMDAQMVADSETTYLNATYHFVLLEEARQ